MQGKVKICGVNTAKLPVLKGVDNNARAPIRHETGTPSPSTTTPAAGTSCWRS